MPPSQTNADADLQNTRVSGFDRLPTPAELTAELPLSPAARRTVLQGRRSIEAILRSQDPRLLVVVGPCSIHDTSAALEYAQLLKKVADKVADRMLVVMRVYFEKPRTTVGWKGLLNDPFLYSDRDFDMSTGLRVARQLLIDINELGLPTGTEFLDPFTPQYLDDAIAWAAIGARTTESQTHRQMASGLSMPVGFKNATTGDLQVALDAMLAAMSPHHFLGIDEQGRGAIVHTQGNPYGHVILRGGKDHTNYHPKDIQLAAQGLTKHGLNPVLMVDCSHANSGKKPERQEAVWQSVLEQRKQATATPSPLIGLMLESNLIDGRQDVPDAMVRTPLSQRAALLKHGQSITDACIDWPNTHRLLLAGYAALA